MASKLFDALFKQTAHIKKLADGNTEFALNLYQVCSETELGRSNLIFSPFSITAALAMTWAGARNETARQIKEVLEFRLMDDDDHIIHQAFFDVLQDLQKANSATPTANISILHSANRFYIDRSYDVLEEFANVISKKYMTELERLDFSKNTDQARQDINEWVRQATNNKVKELIPENVLNATTRIVLVNAIYFKGTWSVRFSPEKIHRGHFYRKKFEKPIAITMMENRAVFPFAIDYDFKCKVLELPYTGSHFRMLIFLPFDVDGLAIFEQKFTPGLVKFLKKSMAKTKVTVVIPQLKMSSSLPLSDSLMTMGIRDLFYHDKSDLSGITGTNDLHYFDFVHNAFLDANEGGRIAHSRLSSKMVVSRHRSQELSFVADHPFLFLIYDKPSKMIFFIGRFSDPASIALGPEMD